MSRMQRLICMTALVFMVISDAGTFADAGNKPGESKDVYDLSKLPSEAKEYFLTLPKNSQEQMIELLKSNEKDFIVLWEKNQIVFQRKLKELHVSGVSEVSSGGLEEESWTAIKSEFGRMEAQERIEQQKSLWDNDNVMTLHQVFTPYQCATLPYQNPAEVPGRYRFTCEEGTIFVDEFEIGSGCSGEKERKVWKNGKVTAVCAADESFVELEFETTNNLLDDELAGKTGIPHSSFWECDCGFDDSENPTLVDCMIVTVETSRYEKVLKKAIAEDGGDALCRAKTKQSSTDSGKKIETYTGVDPHLKPDDEEESGQAENDSDGSRRNLGECTNVEVATQGGSSHEWHDKDGPYYNCGWYSHGQRCQKYGNDYEKFGYTANQACCACDGGMNTKKYKFGTCNHDDFSTPNSKGSRLTNLLEEKVKDATNVWKQILCVYEEVKEEVCNWVDTKVCKHELFSWICGSVKKKVCSTSVVGKNWKCGNPVDDLPRFAEELRELVRGSYNSAASDCGTHQVNNSRRQLAAQRRRAERTTYCKEEPHNRCNPAYVVTEHGEMQSLGTGFEVALSGTAMLFEFNIVVGYAWTGNGWRFPYSSLVLGASTELIAFCGMVGMHAMVKNQNFLGEGAEFNVGVSTFIKEIGISISVAFALPQWEFVAQTAHVHFGIGASPVDIGGAWQNTFCWADELECYT